MDAMSEYWNFKAIHELLLQGQYEQARLLLMELQARYIALHDEVRVLKEQVQEFEDILYLSQNLVAEGEQYWLRTGGVRHGPFCKPCYEYTGKLIRLAGHKKVWRCPYCGLLYSREQSPSGLSAVNSPFMRQGKTLPFGLPVKYC
jgi:sarcosine oxidase delta subunit